MPGNTPSTMGWGGGLFLSPSCPTADYFRSPTPLPPSPIPSTFPLTSIHRNAAFLHPAGTIRRSRTKTPVMSLPLPNFLRYHYLLLLLCFHRAPAQNTPANCDDPFDYEIVVVDAPCFDDLGAVAVSYFGDRPLHITWSSGEVDTQQVLLPAGAYAVTISDTTGCVFVENFEVGEPEQLRADFQIQSDPCAGRLDVRAEPSGGVPPHFLQWDIPLHTTEPEVRIDSPGVYRIVISDSRGCFQFNTFLADFSTLRQNELQLSVSSDCDTALAILEAELTTLDSTYRFGWSTGQLDFLDTVQQAAWYTFSVRDTFDCTLTDSVLVAFTTEPDLKAQVDSTTCADTNDGAIELSPEGGLPPFDLTWTRAGTPIGMGPTISNLAPGPYELDLRDSLGCTYRFDFAIGAPIPLLLDLSDTRDSLDGSARIAAAIAGGIAPYRYDWSTGATDSTLTVNASGEYQLTLTDARGCTATDTIQLLGVATRDPSAAHSVQLFPQPHRGHFQLRLPEGKTGAPLLRLYTSDGRLCREVRPSGPGPLWSLDWSDLPDGQYWLYWRTEDQVGGTAWLKR